MENRTVAIIATIAAVLLCGCPGLVACIFGVLIAAGTPFSSEINGASGYGPLPVWYGIFALCLALIFILIPILVGFFTLRKKPASNLVVPPSEPLPPTM